MKAAASARTLQSVPRRFALFLQVVFFAFTAENIAIAVVATAAAGKPTWWLHAYHLHRHTDATASDGAPVLLSECDLLTDTCALDAVVTALTSKKSAATAGTTQSTDVHRHDFVPVTAVVSEAAPHISQPRLKYSETPESVASAALRKRDVSPTQLHAVGMVDLGTFQAEVVDEAKNGASPLGIIEDEEEADLLPAFTDLGDETERQFKVTFFLGDFTRTSCLGAAVYASEQDVGNLTAAVAAWLPHSVSPACALRLCPRLRTLTGLSLTEEDVLNEWPPSAEQRCHLSEGHSFIFVFTPSLAQAKSPSFCWYEQKSTGAAAVAPTPGTRRLVRCQVYLDVQLLSWYGDTLAQIGQDATVVRVAAAVTEAVVAPTRLNAPAAVVHSVTAPRARRHAAEAALYMDNSSSAVSLAMSDEVRRSERAPFYRRQVRELAATTSRVGSGISRYKGTLRCTSAEVGSGFWFSAAKECAGVVKERLNRNTKKQRRRLPFVLDCLLLFLLALVVAAFAGVLTGRIVKTVRSSRRRVASSLSSR